MEFKKSAIPVPSKGTDYSKEVDIVVPDQSMSLQEILERFTRGEPLEVGHDVQDGDDSDNPLNIDLEKLANSDLVDKAEFVEKLKDVQRRYNVQEKEKAAKIKAQKLEEYKRKDQKRIQAAARKIAKENYGNPA